MNVEYLFALLAFFVFFVGCIYLMKYIRNYRYFNYIFIAVIYISYIFVCIHAYKTDTDPDRWNFLNTLPYANVSPFMFSSMPLLLILPRKVKQYVYLLISLLTVGMFYATVLGCIGNALRNYRFHWQFMLDYLAHITLSLFGIFLIRTKQVNFNVKNCLISASIIYSVATIMLILNVIFDKAFFGLSLNGKHNIYNIVLVDNSYFSALIYYFGLGVVLFLGFILCNFVNRDRFKIPLKSIEKHNELSK